MATARTRQFAADRSVPPEFFLHAQDLIELCHALQTQIEKFDNCAGDFQTGVKMAQIVSKLESTMRISYLGTIQVKYNHVQIAIANFLNIVLNVLNSIKMINPTHTSNFPIWLQTGFGSYFLAIKSFVK